MDKRFLKDYPDMYNVQNDKDNVTVSINRLDYLKHSQDLLEKANKTISSIHDQGMRTSAQAKTMNT